MTPVETLREAARLMRERAQSATPGPWQSFFGRVRRDGTDLFLTTTAGDYGDSPYVASWHPTVALAVADWLDDEADIGRICVPRAAVIVARAYLGGQP